MYETYTTVIVIYFSLSAHSWVSFNRLALELWYSVGALCFINYVLAIVLQSIINLAQRNYTALHGKCIADCWSTRCKRYLSGKLLSVTYKSTMEISCTELYCNETFVLHSLHYFDIILNLLL